jgi:hypothetical protein
LISFLQRCCTKNCLHIGSENSFRLGDDPGAGAFGKPCGVTHDQSWLPPHNALRFVAIGICRS